MSKGVIFESDEKLLECQEKSSIEKVDFVVDEDKSTDVANSLFNQQIFFGSFFSNGKIRPFLLHLQQASILVLCTCNCYVQRARIHLSVSSSFV